MSKIMIRIFGCLMVCALLFVAGCSDDQNSVTGTTDNQGTTDFANFGELVTLIAPPVYTAPANTPSGQYDSMWTDGSYPLLGKVFGNSEPMSLYSNIENLDHAISVLASVQQMMIDSTGTIVTDTIIESYDSTTNIANVVEVQTLVSNTAIPTQAQNIMGFTSVQLDNLVKMGYSIPGYSNNYHIGYAVNDSSETYLTWFTKQDSLTESFLYYAFVNKLDSSIDVRGVFYKVESNGKPASWVYNIKTVDSSDFSYRMSWYADFSPDFTMLGCIIGGGNKDDLFALRYRPYNPADAQVVDSMFMLDQTFDSQYNYIGTGIAAGFESMVNEADMFKYGSMPTALIPSPWGTN